ncbi:DUF190 domain-containing protein [Rhodanobacter sp. Si-c]|uniref:DUF190 domain-containing protein n=1 Tax=Rhodanobacter lycopersici TaxID=3162487 RepID=A0ABV3Q992_9GAMM
MNCVHLRFYTRALEEYHSVFLYEWLLLLARRLGIHAGVAIQAIAGFGYLGDAGSCHVEELATSRPIIVEFNVSDEEADKLLGMIAAEDLRVPYTRHVVEYHGGFTA